MKNLQCGKKQQQQQPTSQKPPRGSPKQVPSLRVLLSQLLTENMITEVLLVLPLCLKFFFIGINFDI